MKPSLLFYADTHQSPDLLYFGKFEAPDPFIAIGHGRKKITLLSALEYSRGLKESAFDEVLSLEDWTAKARESHPEGTPVGAAEIIATFALKKKISHFRVPDSFPAGLCDKLRQLGLKVEIIEGLVFPEREIKNETEAKAIAEGNRCSAAGFKAAEKMLKAANIKGGKLMLDGKPLTSERLRFAIEVACLEAGAVSNDTIVAGGDQACDPHCRGSGPLRANELIIIDIFPRVKATGYHGDMTRTYLRGTPSEAQVQITNAVREAQKAAIAQIKAGVNGQLVHQQCLDVFAKRGFETKRSKTGSVGFFHGTGHGLGLAVHEFPRVSTISHILKAGSVVTVEPGLYYPGVGGCRFEDVVQVTQDGCRMLSKHPYNWHLGD